MPNSTQPEFVTDRVTIISFRQPANINVRYVANQAGTTVNGLLRAALSEYMQRHKLAS
jgi:hypothetical protein